MNVGDRVRVDDGDESIWTVWTVQVVWPDGALDLASDDGDGRTAWDYEVLPAWA